MYAHVGTPECARRHSITFDGPGLLACVLPLTLHRWTIWPTTLTRDFQPEPDRQPQLSLALLKALAPTHHQFYHDDWRLTTLPFGRDPTGQGGDGLPKWTGYADKSERLE